MTSTQRMKKWWRDVVLQRVAEHSVTLLVIAWAVSFGLGLWGYWVLERLDGVTPWLPQEVYRSLHLFTFKGGENFARGPWQLEIARWSSPAVAVLTAMKGLVAVFYDQLQTLRALSKRGHVIVCGLSDKGRLIAKKFLDDGRNVVVIEKDTSKKSGEVQAIRADGAIVLGGTAAESSILRIAGVTRAQLLIATCDDETNAAILYAAAGMRSKARRHLDCLIHIKMQGLESYLWKKADELNGKGKLAVRFFRLEQAAARAIVGQYPAFGLTPRAPLAPRILLTGDDGFLDSMATALAERWMLRSLFTDQTMTLVPLHPQEQEAIAKAKEADPVLFTNIAIGEPGGSLEDLDQAWVLHSDPGAATLTAIELRAMCGAKTEILVRHRHDAGLALWLQNAPAHDEPHVSVFSVYEDTCSSPDLLLGIRRESLAKLIHQRYLEDHPGGALEVWQRLDERARDANRDQADWISRLLSDLGYSVLVSGRRVERPQELSEAEVHSLAELEHRRWCMQKLLAGWSRGTVKDWDAKWHPDLAAWDELSPEERQKDMDAVRAWPSMLADDSVRFTLVQAPSLASDICRGVARAEGPTEEGARCAS